MITVEVDAVGVDQRTESIVEAPTLSENRS